MDNAGTAVRHTSGCRGRARLIKATAFGTRTYARCSSDGGCWQMATALGITTLLLEVLSIPQLQSAGKRCFANLGGLVFETSGSAV